MYDVRKCRGHWHITVDGEDIINKYGDKLDEATARRGAAEMNAEEDLQKRKLRRMQEWAYAFCGWEALGEGDPPFYLNKLEQFLEEMKEYDKPTSLIPNAPTSLIPNAPVDLSNKLIINDGMDDNMSTIDQEISQIANSQLADLNEKVEHLETLLKECLEILKDVSIMHELHNEAIIDFSMAKTKNNATKLEQSQSRMRYELTILRDMIKKLEEKGM